MGLVRNKRKRFDVPDEDGEWIELRPLSNGDLLVVNLDDLEDFNEVIKLLPRVITAWSYKDIETGEPIPVDEETTNELDLETMMWLANELGEMFKGSRSEAEKNESAINS